MAERVFVTGASGFVGQAVTDALLKRGAEVLALVNRRELPPRPSVTSIRADLFDIAGLRDTMRDCRAVIHLVGIIEQKPKLGVTFQRMHVEATRCVVQATREAGIKRYVHMSALGAGENKLAEYHRTKAQAEQIVRLSDLQWTILRPSLIHGPRGDFMRMEAGWARKAAPPYLFMPYFGGGVLGLSAPRQVQPVYVDDVARAFAEAIDLPNTIGKTYDLGGATCLTWPQMHRIAADALVGHSRWVMPIPAWYARLLTRVAPASLLPFNRDQVEMAREDSTCEMGPFVGDFGFEPGGFEQTLRGYAQELKGGIAGS